MSIHEIVLPDTKPETEWILGRAVRKVSRFRTHARLQMTFGAALLSWSAGRGEVGTECDRVRRIEHKTGVYLATGASLVIVVDPSRRTVQLHDLRGVRELAGDDIIIHPALPGFSLALTELFKAADPPPR